MCSLSDTKKKNCGRKRENIQTIILKPELSSHGFIYLFLLSKHLRCNMLKQLHKWKHYSI